MPGLSWLCVPGLLGLVFLSAAPAQAHLYGRDDMVVSLANGAHDIVLNSSSAWFAQFYASWCGHCKHFKPTFQALAKDIKDWRPCAYLAVLNCGDQTNTEACKSFEVKGYPTLKFFNAHAKHKSEAIVFSARTQDEIKQFIIDKLEERKASPPPGCPPLEPISTIEVDQFFQNNEEDYLILIFEHPNKYMARQVALDMAQYDGVFVRRAVSTQEDLVANFRVTSFPSGFLMCKNGSISRIKLESREGYTQFARSLPGVKKLNLNLVGWSGVDDKKTTLRPANESRVYMADLETAIHYSLRVEAARFSTLEGKRLEALRGYINVLNKYFPARPMVGNLLKAIKNRLSKVEGDSISYEDFADVLNNKNGEKDAVLASNENYVACQGSKPEYRGFPCTVWTLFHLLTVQAFEQREDDSDPLEVLNAMRGYIRFFFGCRDCATEFEKMASKTLSINRDHDDAIKWLWSSHNSVNKRLAGNEQEDPEFPKIQWPSSNLCPNCQRTIQNIDLWDSANVIRFLKKRFSVSNILYEYLESEAELLKKQKEGTNASTTSTTREKRDTIHVKEEQETPSRHDTIVPPVKSEETKDDSLLTTKTKQIPRHRPTIIRKRTKTAQTGEKILDLDTYENHYFQVRTLQDSDAKNHKKALHPKMLMDPSDVEFNEEEVRERLLKRGIDTNYLIDGMVKERDDPWKGHWVKMLEVGFSRLDISLCIILYFLTSMGLLAMYLYLNFRSRFYRQRCRYAQP